MGRKRIIEKLKEFRQSMKDIRSATEVVPTDIDFTKEDWLEDFHSIWRVVRPALDIAELFTSAKVDAIINEIQIIGDELATGGANNKKSIFIEKFAKIWEPASRVIAAAMVVTPDRVDEVLERILRWGDWLAAQKV